MSEPQDIDLFAGAGGWEAGGRELGLDPLGIEWDESACATRKAAGLRTLRADVSALDPHEFAPVRGLIASPPCQAWSMAGKRAGALDQKHCVQAALDLADGRGVWRFAAHDYADQEAWLEACGLTRYRRCWARAVLSVLAESRGET